MIRVLIGRVLFSLASAFVITQKAYGIVKSGIPSLKKVRERESYK